MFDSHDSRCLSYVGHQSLDNELFFSSRELFVVAHTNAFWPGDFNAEGTFAVVSPENWMSVGNDLFKIFL